MPDYVWKRAGKVVAYARSNTPLPAPAIEVSAEELESLGICVPPSGQGEAAAPTVEELRAAKLEEAGQACSAAIYAGVDVGESHYSLTEHDQMEIMAQYASVKEGAAAVPYHADGELCRMYPAEEFTALAQAATAHVFCHRTYCNHLNAWIRRAGLEELEGIAYGAELPEDLAASMAAIISVAGGESDAV